MSHLVAVLLATLSTSSAAPPDDFEAAGELAAEQAFIAAVSEDYTGLVAVACHVDLQFGGVKCYGRIDDPANPEAWADVVGLGHASGPYAAPIVEVDSVAVLPGGGIIDPVDQVRDLTENHIRSADFADAPISADSMRMRGVLCETPSNVAAGVRFRCRYLDRNPSTGDWDVEIVADVVITDQAGRTTIIDVYPAE
jgi:hypothetical protein